MMLHQSQMVHCAEQGSSTLIQTARGLPLSLFTTVFLEKRGVSSLV